MLALLQTPLVSTPIPVPKSVSSTYMLAVCEYSCSENSKCKSASMFRLGIGVTLPSHSFFLLVMVVLSNESSALTT